MRPSGVPDKILLVANDKAGSFDEGFDAVCKRIAPAAVYGKLEDVAKGPWDLVVACGGDGTVRLVVNALIAAKSDAALGIVPLGTANIVARTFGLPDDPEEALKMALAPESKSVDVGTCHGEAFLLGCGLGLAERFVTAAGHEEKQKLGPFAYVKRFLSERDAAPVEFCVEAEGRRVTMKGVGLVVANMAQLGPNVKPLGEVAPDDGHLSLILLRRSGLWDLVRLGAKSLFGKAAQDAALEVVPIGKCRISSEPKVPIQIDGDAVEQDSPFEFDVLPGRLTLKVSQ